MAQTAQLRRIDSIVSDAQRVFALQRKAYLAHPYPSLDERKQNLTKLEKMIIASVDELAAAVMKDFGHRCPEETKLLEIFTSVDGIRHTLKKLPRWMRPQRRSVSVLFATGRNRVVPQPKGVVGIVAPWNYPLFLTISPLTSALAAGNRVMIKMASASQTLCRLLHEKLSAVLPEEVVAILPGVQAADFSTLPYDHLVFTGSADAGRTVMRSAAENLTPVTLELGGKSPTIVCDDFDLDEAASRILYAKFVNAGQTCAGVKRIYVQRKISDRFTEAMAMQASRLKMGWGWDDPDVSMGPLISEQALRELETAVSLALEQGARCITGGRRHPTLSGHFYEPTILVDAKQDMDIVQQEVFGPIVTIIPFDSDEEALTLAADCPFALNASIWTRDLSRGRGLAEKLPGGTAVINNTPYTFGIGETPWGGSGESGFGRTHGQLGLLELVETHHVHWDKGGYAQDIWWSPYDQEKREAGEALVTDLFGKEGGSALLKMMRYRRLMKR